MALIKYKKWNKGAGNTFVGMDGWFLFGFIPVYTRMLCRKGGI